MIFLKQLSDAFEEEQEKIIGYYQDKGMVEEEAAHYATEEGKSNSAQLGHLLYS